MVWEALVRLDTNEGKPSLTWSEPVALSATVPSVLTTAPPCHPRPERNWWLQAVGIYRLALVGSSLRICLGCTGGFSFYIRLEWKTNKKKKTNNLESFWHYYYSTSESAVESGHIQRYSLQNEISALCEIKRNLQPKVTVVIDFATEYCYPRMQ